jgi:PPOX class probable F420-dependent enzyme
VPITFALDGDTLYTAVDHKPKRTRALQRLANIRGDRRVTVLVNHYADDWDELWWCRLEGDAAVDEGAGLERARELLRAKYEQYRDRPPEGPAIVVAVTARTGWRA